ncbi:phosphotransferase family protein [Nocardia higoensis]|uniref:phosphotransferase family protein n=1 Tax=Nocardia higoensis TaxID=228599 RepID=UPI0003151CB0|nr:phosphotransferase family protein [Nocardia higoensis]
MSSTATVEHHAGIDLRALDAGLATILSVSESGLRRSLLSGGLSQTTFRYDTDAGTSVIVRIPPAAGPLEPYDPVGEAALLTWLGERGIAVPAVVHVEPGADMIGRPFVVTELVRGHVVQDGAHGYGATDRMELARAYVEQLAAVHRVHHESKPASVLAWAPEKTPDGVLGRWNAALRSAALDLPGYHRFLTDWLLERAPADTESGAVVHGDYRLANVMLGAGNRVVAVLDWEEAGSGDPYFDLAWTLQGADGPDDPVMGLAPRAWFLERYGELTGRTVDPARLAWWEIAAGWSKLSMEAKAVALIRDGVYSDLRPLLSCYLNRRLSLRSLEKVRRYEAVYA